VPADTRGVALRHHAAAEQDSPHADNCPLMTVWP
jgi:hypothetical protein